MYNLDIGEGASNTLYFVLSESLLKETMKETMKESDDINHSNDDADAEERL